MEPLFPTLQSAGHRPDLVLGKVFVLIKATHNKLGYYKAGLETVKYNTNVIKISMCFIVAGGKELENHVLHLNFQTLIKVILDHHSRQLCPKVIY